MPIFDKALLEHTATDMTTELAAESFLYPALGPVELDHAQRFRDLIDLMVNADTFQVTLPATKDPGGESRVPMIEMLRRAGLVTMLPGYGTTEFDNEYEVAEAFKAFAKVRGVDWLPNWLRFQLLNPIVTDTHKQRLEEIQASPHARTDVPLIDPKSLELWDHYKQDILSSTRGKLGPLDIPDGSDLPSYLAESRGAFETVEELALCYAYDVYRRGREYADRAGRAVPEATYFPHPLRNDALEAPAKTLNTLHRSQELLWSWGGCVLKEVEREPEHRNPAYVIELICGIRKAMEDRCPKWHYLDIIDEEGKLKPNSPRLIKEFRGLAVDAALHAEPKLHLDWLVKESELLAALRSMVPPAGLAVLGLLVQLPLGLAYTTVKVAATPIGKLPAARHAGETIEQAARRATPWMVRKGILGFPGLLPPEQDSL
jgi:hypothetical protein